MFGLLMQIQTAVPSAGEGMDFTWLFIKMIFILGIVCISAVLILKYAVPHLGLMRKFHGNGFFQVIDRFPLEQRRSLFLIRAGKRYFVIGSADSGMNLISECTPEEAKVL